MEDAKHYIRAYPRIEGYLSLDDFLELFSNTGTSSLSRRRQLVSLYEQLIEQDRQRTEKAAAIMKDMADQQQRNSMDRASSNDQLEYGYGPYAGVTKPSLRRLISDVKDELDHRVIPGMETQYSRDIEELEAILAKLKSTSIEIPTDRIETASDTFAHIIEEKENGGNKN